MCGVFTQELSTLNSHLVKNLMKDPSLSENYNTFTLTSSPLCSPLTCGSAMALEVLH